MITASNYFVEVERIGINTLPETLKKGHDLVVKSTSNGTNWSTYQSSEGIKKVIDLYFQKLTDYSKTLTVKITPNKDAREKLPKQAGSKPKVKKVKEEKV